MPRTVDVPARGGLSHCDAPVRSFERRHDIFRCGKAMRAGKHPLCNAIAYRTVAGWADYEQIPPWAKIRLLCSNLGIAYDRGAQPWQRLQALLTFRNQIAHGKPEYVQNRRVLSAEQLEAVMSSNAMDQPQSSLESKLTLDKARSALAVVREVEELLTQNIPHELKLGIAVEGWTYRSRELEAGEDAPSEQ